MEKSDSPDLLQLPLRQIPHRNEMEEYCGERLAHLNTCFRYGVCKNPMEITGLCDLILLFLSFNF